MNDNDFVNLTEAGEMLGLTPRTLADVVDRLGIETTSRHVPGRARWLRFKQVKKLARVLGIEVRPLAAAS